MSTGALLNAGDVLDRVRQYYDLESDFDLAQMLGVGKTTPSVWRSRNSIPYELLFTKCSEISFDWMIRGEGLTTLVEAKECAREKAAAPRRADEAEIGWAQGLSDEWQQEQMILLPLYGLLSTPDILYGSSFESYKRNAHRVVGMPATWLQNEAKIDPEKAFAAYVLGEAMEPRFNHGDIVIGELTERVVHDGLYAVHVGGLIHVKHVQMGESGKLRLISENKAYGPIEIAPPTDYSHVVGRVVRRITRA